MKISIKSFLPGVVGLVVATTLFVLPGKEFPEQDWFAEIYLDKWIHVGLFAMLVTLWCLPLIHRVKDSARLRASFIWIALAFVAYGVAIEFIQGRYIPYRTFGVDDMLADSLGCAVGFWFCLKQRNYQTP